MERKLSVGETIGEAFELYGKHAGVLLPLAFWLYLAVAILEGLSGENAGLFVASSLVGLFVGILYEGMVVGLVRDVRDGRRESSMGDLVRMVLPMLVTLVAAGFLYMLGVFFGFLLLIVPGLYLLTIWAVVAPVIVVERRGVFDAFGRSRQLVRGSAWRVLGIEIIAMLIVIVGVGVLVAIGESLVDDDLMSIVFSALATTVIAPISGLIIAVLYFRLRGIEDSVTQQAGDGLG